MVALHAYGLRFESPLPLPGGGPAGMAAADVDVLPANDVTSVRAGFAAVGEPAHRWVDERPLEYVRDRVGDLLVTWGDTREPDGVWRIASEVITAFSPRWPPAPSWMRVLLDSVMGARALRSQEALHAAGVVVDGGAVAVLGGTGGGKSSLMAALVTRGHRFLCDDILVLTDVDGAPAAWPGPPVANLPGAAVVGEPLAVIHGETWVELHDIAAGPVPLRAVIVLDRQPDGPDVADLARAPSAFVALTGHALPTGAVPVREAARFSTLARVAEQVPVLALRARREGHPPEHLARVVEGLP